MYRYTFTHRAGDAGFSVAAVKNFHPVDFIYIRTFLVALSSANDYFTCLELNCHKSRKMGKFLLSLRNELTTPHDAVFIILFHEQNRILFSRRDEVLSTFVF